MDENFLSLLMQPTLIIWGEHDQVFPLELAYRLKRFTLSLTPYFDFEAWSTPWTLGTHFFWTGYYRNAGTWGIMLTWYSSRMQGTPSMSRNPRNSASTWNPFLLICRLHQPPLTTPPKHQSHNRLKHRREHKQRYDINPWEFILCLKACRVIFHLQLNVFAQGK